MSQSTSVVALVTQPIRERNTFRAILADTVDVMKRIRYATPADAATARVQIEAIEELLTVGETAA